MIKEQIRAKLAELRRNGKEPTGMYMTGLCHAVIYQEVRCLWWSEKYTGDYSDITFLGIPVKVARDDWLPFWDIRIEYKDSRNRYGFEDMTTYIRFNEDDNVTE